MPVLFIPIVWFFEENSWIVFILVGIHAASIPYCMYEMWFWGRKLKSWELDKQEDSP